MLRPRTVTCSLCGTEVKSASRFRVVVADSCPRCGARTQFHVRWWNAVGKTLAPVYPSGSWDDSTTTGSSGDE